MEQNPSFFCMLGEHFFLNKTGTITKHFIYTHKGISGDRVVEKEGKIKVYEKNQDEQARKSK